MSFMLSLTAAAGVVTALAVSRRKPQRRLIDTLTQNRLAQATGVQEIVDLLVSSGPKSEAEAKTFAELKRVSVGVGLGVAGLVFYPLQLVGVACLLPTMSWAFKSAYRHLAHERRVSMDVLTAIFLTGTITSGLFFSLLIGGWFVVLIRWLAIKTEDHSKQGIIDLFGQQIRSVWLLVDGVEVEAPVEQVGAGDLIVIHAGQMAPMDGVIVEGHASVDQHMLTGEAQPAEKGPGDRVLAATIVLAGRVVVQVEKTGDETTAAQIGRILTDTSDFKESLVTRATAFNDSVALPFILLSGLSLPFLGMEGALSVLMSTPGYRMVLYGPLSMLSYLHLAAQQGILIKDGRSLELLEEVDTIVFDKTGTLTLDQPHVSEIHACGGFTKERVLAYAAAAETKQSHPIARAILQAAAAQGISPAAVDASEYEIGYGIQVQLDGRTVRVGSRRFMEMHAIPIPPAVERLQKDVHDAGHSLVMVSVDGALAGALVLQPTLRPEAETIVRQLRTRGLQLYIISGDHEAPTQRLADHLSMDGYFAEVLPEDKADLVRQLQAEGRKVCFVGDGINDSIALKTANVSISLHGATTIAIDTAQIVMMEGNLAQLPAIFTLADEFAANMRVNFLAATLPSALILGGALFLGWGLTTSILLYQVSVPFALYNTVRPLLLQKERAAAEEETRRVEQIRAAALLPDKLSASQPAQPSPSESFVNGMVETTRNGAVAAVNTSTTVASSSFTQENNP
jgi:Cu2+-exporting ATPase